MATQEIQTTKIDSETDPFKLFRKFIEEYKFFKDKSEKYTSQGELEGALVNYTLAANSLHHAIYVPNHDKHLNKLLMENADLKQWCNEVCENLSRMQNDILSKIGPLQEELKKRKIYAGSSGSSGSKKDDDIEDCADIFSKQIILEGKDCIFFGDVIGQEAAKTSLKNNFIWPNVYSNLYPKTAKGVLFYGPPGTGKSFLAKAAANEMNLEKYDDFLHILYFAPQGGDLKGKYVGETEKNIQKYFRCASEAADKCQKDKNDNETDPENKKHRVLSILFLDEVDAIAGDRTNDTGGMMSLSVNALLQALDGIGSKPNVSVIAATNFPWNLDSAFLRRFDSKILIDLPSATDIYRTLEYQINDFVTKIETYIKPPEKKEKRITDKNELLCDVSCTESTPSKGAQWVKDLYSPYIEGLTIPGLKALAMKMNGKKYSPSDVNKVCGSVFRTVADRSRRNNTFYKMTYGKFRTIMEPKKIDNVEEGDDKIVYISTLSLTNIINKVINEKDFQVCSAIDNKDCLVILETSTIKSLTLKQGENTYEYIHKNLYAKETFLNDPNVDNFYILKNNDNSSVIQVLFSIKVILKFSDNSIPDKVQTFYVMSRIDTAGLMNKFKSWLGKSEKQLKTDLSTYDSLINNMTGLIFYKDDTPDNYNDQTDEQAYDMYYINSSDLLYLKTGLKNRNFTDVNDEVTESFKNYQFEIKEDAMGNVSREYNLADNIKEMQLIITKNKPNKDKQLDKEAFFTFDLRDSDFNDAFITTPSSIREDEYKQLKEYEKDPSIFKIKK